MQCDPIQLLYLSISNREKDLTTSFVGDNESQYDEEAKITKFHQRIPQNIPVMRTFMNSTQISTGLLSLKP